MAGVDRQTQRDWFDDDLTRDPSDAEPGPAPPPSPQNDTGDNKKEKQRCMWLKYLAFAIVVCGLLAGVIAVVVLFKKASGSKKESLGGIKKDDKPIDMECPAVTITHGWRIVFACNFSQNLGVRQAWDNIDWLRTEVDYPPSHVDKSALMCTNESNYVMKCKSDDVTKATCSSNGTITLKLKTRTGIVTYSTSLRLNLLEKPMQARPPAARKTNNTVQLEVNCKVSGVCKPYLMHIYAYEKSDHDKTRIDGSQLSCVSSVSDSNGHKIECNDVIDAKDMRKGTTKVTCALMDGVDEFPVQETEVTFPRCCDLKYGNCPQECSATMNCTATCPYCNQESWCRHNGNFITDQNTPLEICTILKNNCKSM